MQRATYSSDFLVEFVRTFGVSQFHVVYVLTCSRPLLHHLQHTGRLSATARTHACMTTQSVSATARRQSERGNGMHT